VNLIGIDTSRDFFPGSRLPSSAELAGHLAREFKYPGTGKELDLVRVAQWVFSRLGAESLYDYLHDVFDHDFPATPVHEVLARMPRARRRVLIAEAAADGRDGAHSLPEAEFLRLCKRTRLPTPKLQVRWTDASGRRRYLDALFDEFRVHVEIDGGQHTDPRAWWADMKRQNELWIPGDRVLRFPAWAVRHRAAEVVAQVRAALIAAGWRP
jgi:very-short-patch-repair endonuclease